MGFFLLLLLFLTAISFTLAFLKRSWVGMLIGGLIVLPLAWFMSLYPPFPWAIYVPLIYLIMAIFLFFRK
ncbi:hypothetical protein CIG75_14320 [Tumebacillus algifaecis]|uniref:Uncharacterized protein n=1 Tax=Tumebacillus algifaecis TaxID=1214604 RepID=A0A223D6V6_9BACL|nr:hypothetical protein CIG75_14320 [Tumebacillus algifaecis]